MHVRVALLSAVLIGACDLADLARHKQACSNVACGGSGVFVDLLLDDVDAEELDVCVCSESSCLQTYVRRDGGARPKGGEFRVSVADDHAPESGHWSFELWDQRDAADLPMEGSYAFHVADPRSGQVWIHEEREVAFTATPYPGSCELTPSADCRRASVRVKGQAMSEVAELRNPCLAQLEGGSATAEVLPAASPLAMADYTVCAVGSDGMTRCWVESFAKASPYSFVLTDPAVSIENYYGVVCGLLGDGSIRCATEDRVETVSGTAIQLGLGASFVSHQTELRLCLIGEDGSLVCGVLDRDTLAFTEDWEPPGRYASVGVGGGYLCAIARDQSVRCWDDNYEIMPAPVGPAAALAVDQNGDSACALDLNGAPVCWSAWQLRQLPDTGALIQISSGDEQACGLDAEGKAHCWSFVDDPEDGRVDVPTDTFLRVAASGVRPSWGCGLTEASELKCWGGPLGAADLTGP